MAAPTTIDEYLATLPPPARAALVKVRAAILKGMPGAVEYLSYGMPSVKLNGRLALYFAAWKKHYSVYPASDAVLAAFPELESRVESKASLHFSYDEPVPTKLLTDIAKVRASEAATPRTKPSKRAAAKKKKPAAKAAGSRKKTTRK